jgi:hypothetical protein
MTTYHRALLYWYQHAPKSLSNIQAFEAVHVLIDGGFVRADLPDPQPDTPVSQDVGEGSRAIAPSPTDNPTDKHTTEEFRAERYIQ